MSKPLSDEDRDTLFRTARSYNGYTDEPVSEAELRAIWDHAKMGPTATNSLPARVVWCVSDEAKEKLAACARGNNPDKIRKAPATAIVGMDMAFYEHLPRTFPHMDVRARLVGNPAAIETTAFRNSSLQGAYLILAARALGLDTGPMSGFDNAAVDAAFFAGTAIKSNFIFTIGHGDPATVFERLPRLEFEEANQIL